MTESNAIETPVETPSETPIETPPTPPVETPAEPPKGSPTGQPWYQKYLEHYDEPDRAKNILARYETEADAVRSIPSREQVLSTRVSLPGKDLEGDERIEAHVKVLRQMGAPEEAKGYESVLTRVREGASDEVRARLEDGFLEKTAADALELGLLPWQLEKYMTLSLDNLENQIQARHEECEGQLKKIFRHNYGQRMAEAETVADMLDQDLFGEDNKALGEQERSERGGVAKQMLVNADNPQLYRMLAYVHDRLFSEGSIPAHLAGQGGKDAYAEGMAEGKQLWPNSPDLWERHAREKMKGVI